MRNIYLFENHLQSSFNICSHIIQLIDDLRFTPITFTRPRFLKDIQSIGATGYFDGATKDGFCGAGVALKFNNINSFNFKLHYGTCTNMKAELLALWCLCKFARVFGIVTLQVYGDSKVTIKWATGEYNLQVLTLTPCCKRIPDMENHFHFINFHHIYRE